MLARLGELAGLFLKLGTISFGGPAAHLALMEEEVVTRRKWIAREHFLDLLGATNLIPGPNALEMVAHVGYQRAGLLGLVVASVCFTLPAAAISGVLAWAYVEYGALPEVAPFLQGIKPAVLAVVFAAVWRLGKTALASYGTAAIGVLVAAASLAGANEVLALLAGGLAGTLVLRRTRGPGTPGDKAAVRAAAAASVAAPQAAHAAPAALAGAAVATAAAVPLWQLGLFFLKIGAVLYGTGYVLIAYLEGGLVRDYGWLSSQELIDAVAVGQVTPGPLITTATFVGYLLGGTPGAALATLAIVLPGLVLVAATSPWIPRLRNWTWTARFLDAVGAASVGLIAALTVTLARGTLVDWQSLVIAAVAGGVLICSKVNPAWLILAGAVAGRVLW